MKKILCFLLIGVICMGLFGCGVSGRFTVFPSEQKAMLAHLAQNTENHLSSRRLLRLDGAQRRLCAGLWSIPKGKRMNFFWLK